MNMAAKYCYRRVCTAHSGAARSVAIKGIIFDMDGTLTLPVLDFKGLRERLGISMNEDILEYASNAPPDEKPRIYKTIDEWEKEGLLNMKLRPNIHQLFYFLKHENINTALLTRNIRTGVDAFIEKFLASEEKDIFKKESDIFSMVLTRDFTPVKPHPAAAHHICSSWNIPEECVIFVGDDIQDIECGKAAGTVTVLVNKPSNKEVQKLADHNIDDLSEIIPLLKSSFTVERMT